MVRFSAKSTTAFALFMQKRYQAMILHKHSAVLSDEIGLLIYASRHTFSSSTQRPPTSQHGLESCQAHDIAIVHAPCCRTHRAPAPSRSSPSASPPLLPELVGNGTMPDVGPLPDTVVVRVCCRADIDDD